MSSPAPERPTPEDWHKFHAFGWPNGSVRAVMALMIFGTHWCQLMLWPGDEVPEPLRDLLFIILGHYFAVRGRAPSGEEPGPPPLYLPRGAVRLLLIAGFVVVSVLLYRRGHFQAIGKNPSVVTLTLVFGFLLGVVLQQVARWLSGEGRRLPRRVEDARASISLLAAVLLVALVVDHFTPFLPDTPWGPIRDLHFGAGRYGPEHVLAAIVGFYFGSRS